MMKSVSKLLGFVGVVAICAIQSGSVAYANGLCLPLPSKEFGSEFLVQDFTYGTLEAELGAEYEQQVVDLTAVWPTPNSPVGDYDSGTYHVTVPIPHYPHLAYEYLVFGPIAAFDSSGAYASEQANALQNSINWSVEARPVVPDTGKLGEYIISMSAEPIKTWLMSPLVLVPGPVRPVCTAGTSLSLATPVSGRSSLEVEPENEGGDYSQMLDGPKQQSSPSSINQFTAENGEPISSDPNPSCVYQQFYYLVFNVLAEPYALQPPFSLIVRGSGLDVAPKSMVQTGTATNGGNWLYAFGTTYTSGQRPDLLTTGYRLKGDSC